MRLIFLSGTPNTGKTTTLLSLYDILKTKGAIDIEEPSRCPSSPADSVFFVNYQGKRIGIVTMGDYSADIIYYLGLFCGKDAETLVIANSNKSQPYTIADRYLVLVDDISTANYSDIEAENLIIKQL